MRIINCYGLLINLFQQNLGENNHTCFHINEKYPHCKFCSVKHYIQPFLYDKYEWTTQFTCSNGLQYVISHANNSLRSAHWFWLKGKSSAIWDYIGSPTTHKTLSIKPEPSFKLSLTSFPHMQCRFMNFWTHISWDFQIFSVKASSIKQHSAVYEILDNNFNDWLLAKDFFIVTC